MALRCTLLGAAVVAVFTGPTAPAHPLHTTLTELTYVGATSTAQVSLRVFADDFGAAAGRRAGVQPAIDHSVPDSVALAYVRKTLTILDGEGRSLALAWCGRRRTGDLVWICLRAAAPGGLTGARVHARMLFELYDDQVNIVQVAGGTRRQTLLFTKGDGPKGLR